MATVVSVAIGAVGLLLMVVTMFSLHSLAYSLRRWWRWLDDRCQSYQLYKIPRYADDCGGVGPENPLFPKALAYLHSLPSLDDSADCVNVYSTGRKPNDFFIQLDPGRPVADSFLGSRLSWTLNAAADCLLLRLRRRDRHRVLRPYLHHIETIADDADLRRKELKLFSIRPNGTTWTSVPLSHPATMDTLAVEPELKNRVKSDLESFLKGKGYYARLGRVWKRSYLLHGPPGTGKSTFAAAMAKFLNYDVYDLDLSATTDLDLKSLLLRTTPRSLILVEDLDRHIGAAGAMLNFMDGVFSSCCGEERVMVFTMRGGGGGGGDKEGIDDPALLRPGRMDVHVRLPLCDFTAFKALASSHLGIREHKLYAQVEEGFQAGRARLSPAEVGEIMIANRGSPSRALRTVINALMLQRSSSASSGSRLVSSGSLRKTASESAACEESENGSGGGGGSGIGFGKDATVRELKKLYGLIRTRGGSGSRKEGTMSVQMAAAAAATANAAAAANAANYLDRGWEKDLSCH